MENQSLQIAQTIQQQLFAFNRNVVYSWGAHAWTVVKDGLSFKVQGFLFKGTVRITLTPYDTYKVELIKGKKVEQEYNDVYFDELTYIIDTHVEYTGDNYENDVKNAIYSF
jgi:hypothetical protein